MFGAATTKICINLSSSCHNFFISATVLCMFWRLLFFLSLLLALFIFSPPYLRSISSAYMWQKVFQEKKRIINLKISFEKLKENKTKKKKLKYVSGGEEIMNYYFHSSNVLEILKQSGFVSAFRFYVFLIVGG